MNKEKKNLYPAIFIVLALAAALRIFHLGHESLWIDEGFSIRDIHLDRPASLSKPLYYVFLRFWIHLGQSEVILRLPAVIFGLISIYLIYVLGRDLINARAGVIAALFAAVSPFIIDHSQEVRMYTLLLMVSLATVYYFLCLMREWRLKYAVGYSASALMMLLTQPMSAFLIISLNLLFLMDWQRVRIYWWRWGIAQLAIILGWVPVLPYVFGFGKFVAGWDAPGEKLAMRFVPHFWSWFMMGTWNRLVYPDKLFLRYAHWTYAYILLGLLVAAVLVLRKRAETRLLVIWLVGPILMMLAASQYMGKPWIPRYLIYTAPPVYLLLGGLLSSMRRSLMVIGIVMLLILPLFRLDRYYTNTTRAEWRQAAHYLEQNELPSDFIGIYKPSNEHVFRYYYHGNAIWRPLGHREPDGTAGNWSLGMVGSAVTTLPKHQRCWLVVSRIPDAAHARIYREMQSRKLLIKHKQFMDIDIYLLKAS